MATATKTTRARLLSTRSLSENLMNDAISVVLRASENSNKEVWSTTDFVVLRQVCSALRDLYDQTAVRELKLRSYKRECGKWGPPSPEDIEATVCKALARGCRPTSVRLDLPWSADGVSCALHGVTLLRNLAAAGSVTSVKLIGTTPITEDIAHAVSSVGNGLLHLKVDLYGLADGVLYEPANAARTAAATGLLLQLTGRTLRDLDINDRPCPVAMEFCLSYCTALTRLVVGNKKLDARHESLFKTAEAALLSVLPSLSNLRCLDLYGGAVPPADPAERQTRAAAIGSCLSCLTALTRLRVDLSGFGRDPVFESHDQSDEAAARLRSAVEAEWRALMTATQHMPRLRDLRTCAHANAADLAALTSLQVLEVGSIALPTAAQIQPPAAGKQRSAQPRYSLPPLLERLIVYEWLPLNVASALQRSPASQHVAAPPSVLHYKTRGTCLDYDHSWSLQIKTTAGGDIDPLDAEGRLTVQAVRQLHAAISDVNVTFGSSSTGRSGGSLSLQLLHQGPKRALPPDADVAEATPFHRAGGETTHVSSWLGAVAAELPNLRGLMLSGFALSPLDLLDMSRCLQQIVYLDLCGCSYSLTSLPLLGGLKALEELVLDFDDWVLAAGGEAPTELVIQGSLLSLLVPIVDDGLVLREGGLCNTRTTGTRFPLPRLQKLSIFCEEDETEDWLFAAFRLLRAELDRRPVPLAFETLTYL